MNATKRTYDCRGSEGPVGPLELVNPEAATMEEVVEALNKQHSDCTFFVAKGKNGTEAISSKQNVHGTASSIVFIEAPPAEVKQ